MTIASFPSQRTCTVEPPVSGYHLNRHLYQVGPVIKAPIMVFLLFLSLFLPLLFFPQAGRITVVEMNLHWSYFSNGNFSRVKKFHLVPNFALPQICRSSGCEMIFFTSSDVQTLRKSVCSRPYNFLTCNLSFNKIARGF